LVVWTDMNSQGENIAIEIVETVKNQMNFPDDAYIFRANFTSFLPTDIQEAFTNLIHKPNEYLSLSVDALSTIDLKTQSAFSRYLTTELLQKIPELASSMNQITYHPMQTAILAMVVEREERSKIFTPQQYFIINILIKQSKVGFRTHELKWKREKVFDKTSVLTIFDEIKQESRAIVSDVDRRQEQLIRPLPLNTNRLMKVASTKFGMSPFETLKVLENLYLSGHISYYLTESTSYGKDFKFEDILSAHQLHSEWGQYTLKLIDKGFDKPDIDESSKSLPIVPVKSAERGKLQNQEWKVYQFITKSFLASISHHAVLNIQNVVFNIGDELFTLNARNIEAKGFLEITPWLNNIDEIEFEKFKTLEEYKIDTTKIIDSKTSAVGLLTEAELVNQMESYNIGHNGQLAEHLKALVDQEYIKINKKSRIITSTKAGSSLVKALNEVDRDLISPSIRRKVEEYCHQISFNEVESSEVVTTVLNTYKQKLDYLQTNIDKVVDIFKHEMVGRARSESELSYQKQDTNNSNKNGAETKAGEIDSET